MEVGDIHAGTFGEKHLLIKDDGEIREFRKQFLQGECYTITATKLGQEALNHLRGRRSLTDFVIRSLMLPVADRFDLRQHLMLDPAPASIPVSVVSTAGELPESADLSGDVGYGRKPIKQKPVLLVVDDEAALGKMLDLILSQDGFAVRLAATGKEAIEIYRKHHDEIALVLLDVQMPEMDGAATLAALKKVNPELKCCFMSGSTGKYTSQELLDMGATHVIMKPFASLSILARLLWDMIG